MIRASPEYSRQEKERGLARLYQRIDARFQEVLPRMREFHHAVQRAHRTNRVSAEDSVSR